MSTDWLNKTPLAAAVVRAGRIVYANEALSELLARPRDQLCTMRFEEVFLPEDRERLLERSARQLQGGPVPASYELRVLRLDGSVRTVEIWTAVAEGGDVVFQLLDRTDRLARRVKLTRLASIGASAQREHTDEAILRAVGTGLQELDVTTILMKVEDDRLRIAEVFAPAEKLGAIEKALGRPLRGIERQRGEVADAVWRDGSKYIDDMPPFTMRFLGGNENGTAQALATGPERRRGMVLAIEAGGSPVALMILVASWIREEDQPAFHLFGTQVNAALDAARVIADLSRRNAQLAAINAVATVASTASELTELFARGGRELVRVLACSAVAIYLLEEDGKTAAFVHHVGLTDESVREHARIRTEGATLGIVMKMGTPHVVPRSDLGTTERGLFASLDRHVIAVVPLLSRAKTLGALYLAFRDPSSVTDRERVILQAVGAHFAAAVEATRLIDDLRQSYGALAKAQAQLVERERLAALGELAAVIAHEVRNPLGVIFNSLGGLRKMLPKDREAELLLDILGEEADRLNHIVADLLDFARPVVPSMHPEPMAALVDDALGAALGDTSTNVCVLREYAPDLEPVPMDPRLVRQAVVNLVLNAVQAMNGEGTLRVRIWREDGVSDPKVRVEIADSGVGISPDIESRIFEPFFTTRATGTGLGLAVVRRIIEGHGGDLTVTSTVGEGTSVVFRLPLAPES